MRLTCPDLPGRPQDRHFVQLYGSGTRNLTENTARFVADGLAAGDHGIVIATEENVRSIAAELQRLDLDIDGLTAGGTLTLLDAETSLQRFMRDDRPDPDLFMSSIGAQVEDLRARSKTDEVTAYGEMVAILWAARNYTAAMELEDFWNHLLASTRSRLLCSYPIDIFRSGFHYCDIEAMLASHSCIVPTGTDGLEQALHRAMDNVLGDVAQDVRTLLLADRQPSWAASLRAEAMILWLRNNMPRSADDIIATAQRYHAGQPA